MTTPEPVIEVVEPQKTKKLLPILSLICAVLVWLMPMFVALPLWVAGLTLSIVGRIRQKSKLSNASLVINIVSDALFMFVVVAAIAFEIL